MLTPKQRSFLSSLAQKIQPTVMLGKNGLTDAVYTQIRREFAVRELLKLRFVDFKDTKKDLANQIAETVSAELVRVIGNVAVFYKPAEDPKDREIQLP